MLERDIERDSAENPDAPIGNAFSFLTFQDLFYLIHCSYISSLSVDVLRDIIVSAMFASVLHSAFQSSGFPSAKDGKVREREAQVKEFT